MFFNKLNNLEESPLGYWEEKSYMVVIPENENKDFSYGMYDRINSIEGLNIIDKRELSEKDPGYIKVSYLDEEYEIEYYPSPFTFYPGLVTNLYHFEEKEIEKLKNTHKSLTIFMKFKDDIKKSYHLQLKIAEAIIPDLVAVLDESAEKLLPSRWVRMTTKSNIVPSSKDIYNVQAVVSKNGKVWLHTHGLCRCGLTELEILDSDRENYNNHYNLLSTFASYLIDKGKSFDYNNQSACIGVLSDRTLVVVTCISWTKALKEYKSLEVGGLKDRKEGHNSKTSAIFIYKSEQDEKQRKLSKVSDYDKLLGDNPIFYISNEETARMKALAIERFDFVREQFKNKDNQIIIKVGLVTDNKDSDSLEHIWFELLEIEGDKFLAKLTQEPYHVSSMHIGDEAWFNIEDITDWIIYTKKYSVSPGNVYLLANDF